MLVHVKCDLLSKTAHEVVQQGHHLVDVDGSTAEQFDDFGEPSIPTGIFEDLLERELALVELAAGRSVLLRYFRSALGRH
ncbi:hypothetical protein, partial [Sutterella parvirubra]|uniref:hypothetical protein n=1 Tax=Sutterella parvirubra TaxID=437898 RepID=UPI001C120274